MLISNPRFKSKCTPRMSCVVPVSKVKAINHTMSKKWMCEKIASIMDNDRDGVVSQEEAQVARSAE